MFPKLSSRLSLAIDILLGIENAPVMKDPAATADIFGLQMDALTSEQVVCRVDEAIREKCTKWLTFVNVAILVQCRREPAALRLLEAADYRLCDGMGILYASRLLRSPLPEMIGGPLLLARLLRHAEEHRYGVFFLGSAQEVIEKVVSNAKVQYPALRVVGWRNGFFSEAETNAVVQSIRSSGADLLFVGMGFPRERQFLHKYRSELNTPVLIDLGGGFTILAGIHRLAPHWMRVAGVEWVYRMAQEPRRLWKRYLFTNSIFGWFLLRALITKKR